MPSGKNSAEMMSSLRMTIYGKRSARRGRKRVISCWTGGAVLAIDEKTRCNVLELFFISPEHHSRGIGHAAWLAIEAAYPDTRVWRTITPYFEERNIHFYVNKCGFRIVEFFNPHHIDPDLPHDDTHQPGTEKYFLFEKIME